MTTGRPRAAFAAMIFAVAMTFIDQTIVSVAAPRIQIELGLTSGALQWGINAYLIAMAALFAAGGRLADTVGARRMVTVGVAVFAVASALCALTPSGRFAAAWLITFRAVQGAGGALMYPAALAIVVAGTDPARRGRTLATFFGIAGALTAVGPALGGYLTVWTWRSIFWINVPVAAIALALIVRARIQDDRRSGRLDVRGILLITPGVASSVIGLQQSAAWGWDDPRTIGALVVGTALLVAFAAVERSTAEPLIDLTAFRDRAFAVDNAVLFGAMIVFVPLFFVASEYGQIALGRTPAQASLLLLYFFSGFVVAAQIGGRWLDRVGARRPVVLGAVVAAVGLHQWAGHVTTLAIGTQAAFIVLAGAGLGLLLGPANTDALNRFPATCYGQATGITQTVRNYGSSVGLAVAGAILLGQLRSHLTQSLTDRGLPAASASRVAAGIAKLNEHRTGSAIPMFVRLDFAKATGSVLTALSWVMVATAVVAAVGLSRRRHRRPAAATVPTEIPQLITVGGK